MTKIESNPDRAREGTVVAGISAAPRKPYQKPVLDDYGDAGEVTKNNHAGINVVDITSSYS